MGRPLPTPCSVPPGSFSWSQISIASFCASFRRCCLHTVSEFSRRALNPLLLKNIKCCPGWCSSGIECGLRTKGSQVRFPAGAHAWVAGQVPTRGHMRGNHTLIFLSLSFSLPSSLSKNKMLKKISHYNYKKKQH